MSDTNTATIDQAPTTAPATRSKGKPSSSPREELLAALTTAERKQRDTILTCIAAVGKERRKYQSTANDEPPKQKFYDSIIDLLLAFGTPPTPPDLLAMTKPVTVLAKAIVRHLNQEDYLETQPHFSLWGALDGIDQALAQAKAGESTDFYLEDIQDLFKQGVSDRQIAHMSGLSLAEVMREREKPGSVCVAGWTPPIFEQWQRERRDAASQSLKGVPLGPEFGTALAALRVLVAGGFGLGDEEIEVRMDTLDMSERMILVDGVR